MTWAAGADKNTGDLVTAANWNSYMGATGGLEFLNDRFNWKATSVEVLALTNETSTTSWTDLDLTASTSANAILAFLELYLKVDSIATGTAVLGVRKNGDTPTHYLRVLADDDLGDVANALKYAHGFCGCDAGEVIEYDLTIGGTIQVDAYIRVLGYFEKG